MKARMPAIADSKNRAAALAAICATLAVLVVGFAAARADASAPARTEDPVASASVIGGRTPSAGMFPFMAFVANVEDEGVTICSGSVLSPWVVLTAAHCLFTPSGSLSAPDGFRVVTGVVDWTDPARQLSGVARTIPFPRYKPHSRDGFGDVALLVLSEPTTVPRVRLATGKNSGLLRTGARALIAGWGQTDPEQEEPTFALQWTRMRLEGERNCEGFFGRICAIDFPDGRSGACHGDSGGPLLGRTKRGHKLIQIGIVQGGFGACSTRRPSIYMRADVIARWVNTRVRKINRAIAANPPAPPAPEPAPATPTAS
jgi:secreted trypsin-like serine protease